MSGAAKTSADDLLAKMAGGAEAGGRYAALVGQDSPQQTEAEE